MGRVALSGPGSVDRRVLSMPCGPEGPFVEFERERVSDEIVILGETVRARPNSPR